MMPDCLLSTDDSTIHNKMINQQDWHLAVFYKQYLYSQTGINSNSKVSLALG